MTLSLRARLLVGVIVLAVAGLSGAAFATHAALEAFLVRRVDAQLTAGRFDAFGYVLDQPSAGRPSRGGQRSSFPGGTYVALVDSTGTPIVARTVSLSPAASSSAAHPAFPAHLAHPGPGSMVLQTWRGTGGITHYRVLVEPVDQAGSTELVLAMPLTDVESTLSDLLLLEVLITLVTLLAMAVVAWLVIRVSLRPLERIAVTARAIADGDLGRRVEPATSRTEIGRLGLALNQMLTQIEGAFAERTRSEQRLRRFVADASHELRTPLTSIRGYAEMMRRGADRNAADAAVARRRIEQEAVRMTALVEDLLLLARLDQGRPLEHEPVDLRAMGADALADARAVAPGRPISLDAPSAVIVTGDEMRLRQVVGNLVRNALVHTPVDSPVEVLVLARDGRAALTVSDHGPGVPAAEAERLFEPFYRSDPGRSRDRGGSGLGLSIVAAVVAAHSGTVGVAPTPGGGATFTVELPLADTPAAALDEEPKAAAG